jgi:anti-anti-sigma factor
MSGASARVEHASRKGHPVAAALVEIVMQGNGEVVAREGPADLTVTIVDGTPPVVVLAGEVDLATAPQFEKALISLLIQGRDSLAVDLGRVTYLDSTGINVLMKAMKLCNERGGKLAVVAASERAMRVMRLLNLDRVMPIRQRDPMP